MTGGQTDRTAISNDEVSRAKIERTMSQKSQYVAQLKERVISSFVMLALAILPCNFDMCTWIDQ